MNCPVCKKYSTCGCKACKDRRRMPRHRAEKMRGDYLSCPYCKATFHYDQILNMEYERIEKEKKKLDRLRTGI